MRRILLFLFPATTVLSMGLSGSETLELDSTYSSITGDPGLFHYGKMKAALTKGEMLLARSHARARIPYLTLTTGPRDYQRYHASGPRITSVDKITFKLGLDEAENETRAITLERMLIKAGDDARIVRIPLSENFSDEIERVLKENEDRLEAIEQGD